MLTLTATPIPRTLNMSLGGLRDMSLITTPPADRLAVKTFVGEWNDVVIREACLREIKRGGQVYFIHNRVEDIASVEEKLNALVPEASIRVGHGQMPERQLEQVMLDFYHRRFNVLLCTTIVESGLDVPTANTIVINRADRFGLAQLHQLRGRVGRSHHRAYAYLVAPPRAAMTADAIKRLEAIDSLDALGSGFVLATHDLEIRGAGELLGDTQSGQIQEIGFSLYTELLGRAVESLAGRQGTRSRRSIERRDRHQSAYSRNVARGLYARRPLAPDPLQTHRQRRFQGATEGFAGRTHRSFRFIAGGREKTSCESPQSSKTPTMLGIEKIDASEAGGYIQFGGGAKVDPVSLVQLVQDDAETYRLQSAHRLQFRVGLSDTVQRFKFIEELLTLLVAKPDTDAQRAMTG